MLLKGDCLELLKSLPDASVDSIVTDPPYELGFMGKSWDNSGIAYNVEVWKECLRVLKPGGHLLAFGGSRTYHRLACAVEDAGFEVRDQIMWIYGSGFPKSLDVSKAIDKRGGSNIGWFGEWLKQEREKRGISRKELAQHFPSQQAYGGKPASGNTTGCVGNWETGVSVPTNEQFNKLCEILDLPFAKLEEAEREVIKERTMVQGGGTALQMRVGERREVEANITAPATDEAKKWEGWGTALKPAHEPIVVARKPLIGTVANNVLTYGTGALNIDGSRVAHQSEADRAGATPQGKVTSNLSAGATPDVENGGRKEVDRPDTSLGRWPANVIHDGSDEVLAGFPNAKGGAYPAKRGKAVSSPFEGGQETEGGARQMGDDGSAARFFFSIKGDYDGSLWHDLNLQPETANAVELGSSQQGQHDASVLVRAVNLALPVGLCCVSLSVELSTNVTANESKKIVESVMQATQSIGARFWQGSEQQSITLSSNLAKVVATQKQTGITTITVSHWKSDGYAEPVTFSITPEFSELGAKDSDAKSFIYCAKASKAERNAGLEGLPKIPASSMSGRRDANDMSQSKIDNDVTGRFVTQKQNFHPTVKPLALMRYLIKLVTPPGGVVFDPFLGSGTTAVASTLEGFQWVGCELTEDYWPIIEARVSWAENQKQEIPTQPDDNQQALF